MITSDDCARLRSAAEQVQLLKAQTAAARAQRNQLIRELIGRGATYRTAGHLAHLSVAVVAGAVHQENR